jgi:hypothetical protein
MLRKLLGDVYDEMFPTPPTIEPRRPPVSSPVGPVLVEGRPVTRPTVERIETEALIERPVARSRKGDLGPPPEPRPSPPAAAAVLPRRTTGIQAMLGNRQSLRQAILIQEILGPPKSLQPPEAWDEPAGR